MIFDPAKGWKRLTAFRDSGNDKLMQEVQEHVCDQAGPVADDVLVMCKSREQAEAALAGMS